MVAMDDAVTWSSGRPPVASLHGELDLANAAAVFADVRRQLISDGRVVVVDLSAVTFIDSTALDQLIALRTEITLRVVAPPGGVPRRVIEVAGLTEFLQTFDTLEAALKAS
jgi:anti-anti-sigma factor